MSRRWPTASRSAAATASSKGTICETIAAKDLPTLDAVRAHTKASSSCGSCTAIGRSDPRRICGGVAVVERDDPPMCKCTERGHDEVRRAIVEQRAHDDRRRCAQALGWKTADGCQKCRPALNYYLLCAWPDTYRDDAAIALRQRARARQHPEGRHVFGRAADVGRADQPARAARHRRRRREIRGADGQGHRRPAHRPARRQEGGLAGDLGRPQRCRARLRPRLRQGRCAR